MSAAADAREFGPWPEAVATPRPVVAPREPEASPVKLPFLGLLWFYRNAISPLDGVRCGLYPTCSGFATEAIRRHGPLAGGFLAADRLIHEASVRPPEYEVIEKFGRKWLHDPVELNDRLFRDGPPPAAPEPKAFRTLPPGEETLAPPASLFDGAAAAALARERVLAGDAYRAITELRRAAFLAKSDAHASAFLLEGGWTAAAAGAAARGARPGLRSSAGIAAYDEADRLFDDAGRRAVRAEDKHAERRAEYGRAMTYLSRGYFPEASRRLSIVGEGGQDDLARDAAWLAAWAEFSDDLEDGRSTKEAAKDRFAPFIEDELRGESARGVIEDTAADSWKRRSPGAAAVMSFLLPGSGYVYAGKPLIGFGSFVLNGAFIAGIVLAARDGNYPLAVILLSLETGWYVGGATGAALEIAEQNELGRRKTEQRLRKRFLGSVWPGGAAGALLF